MLCVLDESQADKVKRLRWHLCEQRVCTAFLQTVQLARPKSTADNEQLMHAFSLMLTFSVDTLIIEHVLCAIDAGASSSFFAR